VAPLREQGRYAAFPKLTPEVRFGGQDWIVRVQEMAAVTSGSLGPPIGRIDEAGDDLLRAIDILTRGF
jgi:toxin CcdB